MATTLWGAADEAAWASAWASYDSVLASVQKSELAELDGWYLASFPPILRAREPEPFVQKQELQRLMEWKLKKGKWRPQLMKFVAGLGESDVEQASRDAFKRLKAGDLRAATEALCTLKGVGPATASAVLAAYDQSAPFMADEALEAIAGVIGPRKYTLPHFLSFAGQLRAKAEWLNEQRAANDDEKAGATEVWTAQRVQLCLYAAAHAGAAAAPVNKKTKAPSPAAKQKREKTTTPPSAKKKEKKVKDENAEEQDRPLRRSQRKRQSPTP
ncbi:hypothetical protein PF005_g23578 [Phytophthora fragariae]|uniref:Uncharacterized protein n=1 Tax=Phytophthora fragariae TaxID=53985 RepID=A0A6A3ICL9_9STRA|nr:hypothetical protein PF003_g33340 [Phytophthora fragariae]KAE8929302.1 hypothetical protein PF009_g20582 [Phytophthora fragariae]KAE8980809.1 hypothetical protein PF011_g22282 [Phytophthora fragariae]KAE9078998.1 hypothetical protein PF010_g22926 [Phytophthora fragariae]KAE9085253.1 hypothetical protein PF007_g21214 [Phytophthora fragariae]